MAVNTANGGRPKATAVITAWFIVLILIGIVYWASTIPGRNILPLFPFQDVAYHFGIFAALAVSFSHALRISYPRLSVKNILLFTLVFAVLYGITDELHQIFTPGRSVSAFDAGVDSLGALTGGVIYRWLL